MSVASPANASAVTPPLCSAIVCKHGSWLGGAAHAFQTWYVKYFDPADYPEIAAYNLLEQHHILCCCFCSMCDVRNLDGLILDEVSKGFMYL